MEAFVTLWALLVGGWAVVKLLVLAGRLTGRGVARRRAAVADRMQRPARERAEREAAADQERATADRGRRADARAACEFLYALHAPEIAKRFPRPTFERFVTSLLGDDATADVVERRASELQALIRSHAEHVGVGEPKAETVGAVQDWYAAQVRELGGVADPLLRQSFEAVLLQKYHDRMMRAMGADE